MARKRSGIRTRHRDGCRSYAGGRCNCTPTYEAMVGSGRTHKIRRSFKSEAEAHRWRVEALAALQRGDLTSESRRTVREAAAELLDGMRAGTVRNRSGDSYKPSVIRSYDEALRVHILPDVGAAKLSELRHRHVQAIADRLHANGKSPSTIRNAIMPLRVIYRRAQRYGEATVNPCANLDLPAVRGRRDRIVSPEQATALLAALPESERALWATALYAGLRCGELRALTWADIDFAAGVIRVERAMDARGSIIAPKSAAGRRAVPLTKNAPSASRRAPAPHPGRTVGVRKSEPALQPTHHHETRRQSMGNRRPGTDRPPRRAAHVRVPHDRGRGEREGALRVHGPFQHHNHVRPIRALDAGQPRAGCEPAGRLPLPQRRRWLDARGHAVGSPTCQTRTWHSLVVAAACGGHTTTRTVTVTHTRVATCAPKLATAKFEALTQAKQVLLDDRRMLRAHLVGRLALRVNRGMLRELEPIAAVARRNPRSPATRAFSCNAVYTCPACRSLFDLACWLPVAPEEEASADDAYAKVVADVECGVGGEWYVGLAAGVVAPTGWRSAALDRACEGRAAAN
jgi:integrase